MTIEQDPGQCNVDTRSDSRESPLRGRPLPLQPIIRRARPEDGTAAAPLILTAGPDAFRYALAARSDSEMVAFIARGFAAPRGSMSWRHHWIAELDGAVIGTAAGFRGLEALLFFPADLKTLVMTLGPARVPSILARAMRLGRMIDPPPHWRTFYIANVAVARPHEGRGVCQALFARLHEEAKALGATRCVLDVSMENPRAEGLYAHLGYQVIRTRHVHLRHATGHVPGHRRMERLLQSSAL